MITVYRIVRGLESVTVVHTDHLILVSYFCLPMRLNPMYSIMMATDILYLSETRVTLQ